MCQAGRKIRGILRLDDFPKEDTEGQAKGQPQRLTRGDAVRLRFESARCPAIISDFCASPPDAVCVIRRALLCGSNWISWKNKAVNSLRFTKLTSCRSKTRKSDWLSRLRFAG